MYAIDRHNYESPQGWEWRPRQIAAALSGLFGVGLMAVFWLATNDHAATFYATVLGGALACGVAAAALGTPEARRRPLTAAEADAVARALAHYLGPWREAFSATMVDVVRAEQAPSARELARVMQRTVAESAAAAAETAVQQGAMVGRDQLVAEMARMRGAGPAPEGALQDQVPSLATLHAGVAGLAGQLAGLREEFKAHLAHAFRQGMVVGAQQGAGPGRGAISIVRPSDDAG